MLVFATFHLTRSVRHLTARGSVWVRQISGPAGHRLGTWSSGQALRCALCPCGGADQSGYLWSGSFVLVVWPRRAQFTYTVLLRVSVHGKNRPESHP